MPISLITSGRSLDQDRWRQIKKGRQRLTLCRPYADAGIGAQREACRKRRCFSISTWRETTKQQPLRCSTKPQAGTQPSKTRDVD